MSFACTGRRVGHLPYTERHTKNRPHTCGVILVLIVPECSARNLHIGGSGNLVPGYLDALVPEMSDHCFIK